MSDDLAERCKSLGRVLEEQWLLDAGHKIERLRELLLDLYDHEPLNELSRLRVREALRE